MLVAASGHRRSRGSYNGRGFQSLSSIRLAGLVPREAEDPVSARIGRRGASPRSATVAEEKGPGTAAGDLVEHAAEARLAVRLVLQPTDLELPVKGVHELGVRDIEPRFLGGLCQAAALLRCHPQELLLEVRSEDFLFQADEGR